VTDPEFDAAARRTARRLDEAPFDERIAAACRGSGNPAALAWLAEQCGLEAATRVVDLGTGLGGAAAWIERRYACRPVVLEPAASAASGAGRLFDLPAVRADAGAAPFRDDAFDVALLFGVLSVAPDPESVVQEAARLAGRVAVLDYVSTGDRSCRAGGSRFPTTTGLVALLAAAGLDRAESVAVTMSPPPRWVAAQDAYDATDEVDDARRAEQAVRREIDAGRLAPVALVALRD
jgi:SAM-dependent methyltransferase